MFEMLHVSFFGTLLSKPHIRLCLTCPVPVLVTSLFNDSIVTVGGLENRNKTSQTFFRTKKRQFLSRVKKYSHIEYKIIPDTEIRRVIIIKRKLN
jgi:hypothetical protein